MKVAPPALLAAAVILAPPASPEHRDHQAIPFRKVQTTNATLHLRLGTGSLEIRGAVAAKVWANQGLRLTHAFEAAEAVRAFKQAQQADPGCAMCYWGEALALGPTVNLEMNESARRSAAAALARAAALAAGETPRNRKLIEALLRRYRLGEDPREAYAAYAAAMADVADGDPLNDELQVLAADADMLADRKWWEPDGRSPRPRGGAAYTRLRKVLARHPQNTAATHLFIHLTERSEHWFEAVPFVAGLRRSAPDASHMIHMAAHVYYRAGKYDEATHANLDAIAADRRLAGRGGRPRLPDSPTFRHNVYFAMSAALLCGNERTARRLAADLLEQAPLDSSTPQWTFPIYALAMIADPALAPPSSQLLSSPFLLAMRHYALGTSAYRQEDEELLFAELENIRNILADREPELKGAQLATVRTAVLELAGRLAMLKNDPASAAARFQEAAAAQRAAPSLDPPFWWYPIERSAAAAELALGDPLAALGSARRALDLMPGDPRTLESIARAESLLGRRGSARATRARALTQWRGADLRTATLIR